MGIVELGTGFNEFEPGLDSLAMYLELHYR